MKELHFAETFTITGLSVGLGRTITAPLTRVKLLLQCQNELIKQNRLQTPYTSPINCFKTIYKSEGLLSLFRGNSIAVLEFFPKQIITFLLKDKVKQILTPAKQVPG